jgi:SAM-dependent methyltransferase
LTAGSYDPGRCDLCGSDRAEVVLDLSAPSMTSDSRIVDAPLRKLDCADCGLVRNGFAFDTGSLRSHYGENYELALHAAEPLVFADARARTRSELFFEWILEGIAAAGGCDLRTAVEIGCGEGSLLARVQENWPQANVVGLDLSPAAVEVARTRGLDARVGGYYDADGSYDLVYSVAVIEHVPSPRDFLERLSGILSPGGLLVTAQPCQDVPGSDVFFNDHLWHFAGEHLRALAGEAGLGERARSLGGSGLEGFSLHVFARDGGGRARLARIRTAVPESIRYWRAVFAATDAWLESRGNRPLAVWGVGQTFQLLRAYTALGDQPIALGIDDNPHRFVDVYPFPVERLEGAEFQAVPDILLTFAASDSVAERLAARGLSCFSPLAAPSTPRRSP